MLPIDRTNKTALDSNLVNGNTSDAPVIKNSNDVVYNTIDELYNYTSGLVAGGVLQPYPAFLSRQALINGNFDVWQRGTSWTNPANGTYQADRWQIISNADTGTFPTTITYSRQTLTSGDIANAYYFNRISPNGSGSTFGANAYYILCQKIENGARFLCGSGKKITISFWARSSIANKRIGVDFTQNYGTGGTPTAEETIGGSNFTLTPTWTKYTVKLNTNTLVGKTFGTNNDDYIRLDLRMMWGANSNVFVGATTAETFVGSGDIDIAQVQVNAGDQALPFQPRSFAEELALCKRYCHAITDTSATNILVGLGSAYGTTGIGVLYNFPVQMRVPPTLVATAGDWQVGDGISTVALAGISLFTGNNSKSSTEINATVSAGLTQFRLYYLTSTAVNKLIIFDSEI